MAFFGKRYGGGVWAALALMLLSALCSAATDLSFNAVGYAWQGANNVLTAAYSLALRAAPGTARDALLVVCGDHFAYVVSRPIHTAELSPYGRSLAEVLGRPRMAPDGL